MADTMLIVEIVVSALSCLITERHNSTEL